MRVYFERGVFNAVPLPLALGLLSNTEAQIDRLEEVGMDRFLSDLIHETVSPLNINNDTNAHEFLQFHTKDRLRWETIGFILASAGLAAVTSPSSIVLNILGRAGLELKSFVNDTVWATGLCVEICQRNCSLNDIYLWMIYQNTLMLANHLGDLSKLLVVSTFAC